MDAATSTPQWLDWDEQRDEHGRLESETDDNQDEAESSREAQTNT
jgi:hypothetical protein